MPLGMRAGGAMPGPTLLVHVAALEPYVGMSAATSAKTNRRLRTLPTTRLTRGPGQRYVSCGAVSADRYFQRCPTSPASNDRLSSRVRRFAIDGRRSGVCEIVMRYSGMNQTSLFVVIQARSSNRARFTAREDVRSVRSRRG